MCSIERNAILNDWDGEKKRKKSFQSINWYAQNACECVQWFMNSKLCVECDFPCTTVYLGYDKIKACWKKTSGLYFSSGTKIKYTIDCRQWKTKQEGRFNSISFEIKHYFCHMFTYTYTILVLLGDESECLMFDVC